MTWWRYSLFRKRVRFQCRLCGHQTGWLRLTDLEASGESLDSWSMWWEDLHVGGSHVGRNA